MKKEIIRYYFWKIEDFMGMNLLNGHYLSEQIFDKKFIVKYLIEHGADVWIKSLFLDHHYLVNVEVEKKI